MRNPNTPKILLITLLLVPLLIGGSFAPIDPPQKVETTTATSCTETDITAQDGSFSVGYTATFETLSNGTSVKMTFELLDTDKEGVVAFLWKQDPFTETQMTNVGGNVFSETITGLTNGETITYACKFAFAGGLAVTKYISYDVGAACDAGPEADATLSDIQVDGISIEAFSPDKERYRVEYSSEVTSVPTVTATTTQSGASAAITEANSLPGTTTIVVTAENGVTTKTYSVIFQVEYVLVWSDEFDSDGAVNSDHWHHQTFPPFGGSWANGEIQHYTDRTTNSIIEDGVLKIIGKKEPGYFQDGSTKDYTSARLNSKYAFTYGRVDISAKMPPEKGTWPALWLLGKNINESGAYWQTQGFGTTTWPVCGEIDIMEQFIDKSSIAAAIHTPISFGNTENKGAINATTSTTDFHLYSIIWTEDEIQFLYDDEEYYTYNPVERYGSKNTNPASNGMNWPFDEPQYLILNVALGGLVGNPDENFVDATMEVDYVRVYKEKSTVLTFSDATFSVEENSPAGTGVGTILASYAGSGALSYSIIDGNEEGIFEIDASTGVLSVADASKLDFETQSSYVLTVEVTDGDISETATITVNIEDVNENVLSVNGKSLDSYSIYPNPVTDYLKFEVAEAGSIELHSVIDLIGKSHLIPTVLEANTYTLDFSNTRPGIYLLIVEDMEGLRHIKIQKR